MCLRVQFKFKNSRKSNNGTDVGSGQIPELLYKIPEFEQESGGSVQVVGKEFASTVTPVSRGVCRAFYTYSVPNSLYYHCMCIVSGCHGYVYVGYLLMGFICRV